MREERVVRWAEAEGQGRGRRGRGSSQGLHTHRVEREVRGTRYRWARGGEPSVLEAGSEPAEGKRSNACRKQIAFCLLLHLVDAVGASIEHASHGKCGGEPMTRAEGEGRPGPLGQAESGRP